jgi:hypothetical protein
MNSIVKLAAKFTDDLNQLNDQKGAKQNEIQYTKAKLGEVLKKNLLLLLLLLRGSWVT